MSLPPSEYVPVSCEFHDVLEAHATSRNQVRVLFRDADGNVQERVAALTDVFSRAGAEYVSMSTGETVRLDRLVTVGGDSLPGG
jgi:Rho-binding antiterminator